MYYQSLKDVGKSLKDDGQSLKDVGQTGIHYQKLSAMIIPHLTDLSKGL